MQYLLNLLISHPFPDSIILIQKYPDKIYEVGEKISRPLAKRERDSDVESRVVVSDKRTLQFSILKIHPSPCNIPVRLACHGNHPRLNNRSSCACILTHFDLFVRRLIRPRLLPIIILGRVFRDVIKIKIVINFREFEIPRSKLEKKIGKPDPFFANERTLYIVCKNKLIRANLPKILKKNSWISKRQLSNENSVAFLGVRYDFSSSSYS